MSSYENLLVQLEDRLKEKNIKKGEVSKYLLLYGFEPSDLERLLSVNWDNAIILNHLITTISFDNEYRDKKVELLEHISDNTDIKYDKDKIKSLTSLVKNIDLFSSDLDMLDIIVNMVLKAKTELGAVSSVEVTNKLLEYFSEDDQKVDRGTLLRMVEIVGFMTREEEIYKVEAAKEITKNYSKNKIGSMCGLVAIMDVAKNKDQAQMVVDISKNKGICNHGLELEAAIKAVKTDINGLEELSEVLSYSNLVAEDDLRDDINAIKESSKTRKIIK